MSELNRKLVCAIISFLKKQLSNGDLNEDEMEGLTIGIQCLETAYNTDGVSTRVYDLEDIFEKYLKNQDNENDVDCEEQKTVAEILKNEGNNHMTYNNFKDAISCYTKAIELDPRNAIYYCNRAAALNSFGNHDTAIEDCRTALKYNPLYHKAYARMGVAHKAKNELKEATDCFKKALELQPDNENYKTQLAETEQALKNSRDYLINLEINGSRLSLGNIDNDLTSLLNMAGNLFHYSNP